MSALADTALCSVRGCGSRVHGNGLCRVHYDENRYLATTGRDPEVMASAARERWIEQELRYGSVPAGGFPSWHRVNVRHARRAAGGMGGAPRNHHGRLRRSRCSRSRPWAWWHYFAEREPYVISYEDQRDARQSKSTEEEADIYDEYVMEPVLFSRRSAIYARTNSPS